MIAIGEKCPTPGDSLDENTIKQTETSPSSSASAPAKWIKNDPEQNLFSINKANVDFCTYYFVYLFLNRRIFI